MSDLLEVSVMKYFLQFLMSCDGGPVIRGRGAGKLSVVIRDLPGCQSSVLVVIRDFDQKLGLFSSVVELPIL